MKPGAKISVFSCINRNFSLDRYARELCEAFPAAVESKLVHFETPPGPVGRAWGRLKYPRIAKQQQGDCNIIVSDWYSYLLNALDPSRTVVVCHDLNPLLQPPPLSWREQLYSRRYTAAVGRLRRARFVVTVSENTRRDLLRFFPQIGSDRVVTIHNGLHDRWFEPPAAAAIAELKERVRNHSFVLTVGSDVWYKNLSGAIRAFAQLGDKDLVLVHVGSLGARNRQLIRDLGLSERFLHLGPFNDEQLRAAYSQAAALVFPSLNEGFGWPPLEAMACGCPVVATRRGSLPEVCGEACVYADPDDATTIAAGIREAIAASDTVKVRGKQQARQFNWRKTAEQMLELFEGAAQVHTA